MKFLKSWRLSWTLEQICTLSNYNKHHLVLVSSWKYWLALLIKLLPGVYKSPIRLRLKQGGTFGIVDFMSLYIYNEIFIMGIYDYPDLGIDDPVILDIGANTGLFTLRMKELYPNAALYCYEPFPSNFEQLERNIKFSELKHIELIKKGVGGNTRSDKLYINKSNLGGHSLFENEARSHDFMTIEILGIGEIIKNLPYNHIHLIKLDCEGAEFEILKAIDRELASGIKFILFESTESVYNLNGLIEHLTFLGFEIEFIEKSCNYIARNLNFDPRI